MSGIFGTIIWGAGAAIAASLAVIFVVATGKSIYDLFKNK